MRRGRDHDRQDQHARVRRRQPDVQRGVRRDAQSVRPVEDLRRLFGRRGGGGGLRHAALRRRQRPGREPAQSRQLLQRRRLPAHAGPRARLGRRPTRGTPLDARPDRAHGGRRGVPAFGDGRARIARARLDQRAGHAFREAARARLSQERASPGAATSAACRSDPRVTAVLEAQRKAFRRSRLHRRGGGARSSPARPKRSRRCARSASLQRVGAADARASRQAEGHRVWNIEQGLEAHRRRKSRAREALRTEIFHRMRAFLERYDFLRLPGEPGAAVPGGPRHIRREIAGVKLDNYIDWMKSCYYITVTSHPAISVPAGFTPTRPAGRPADRRPLPRRLRRAAARARVRAARPTSGSAARHWQGNNRASDCVLSHSPRGAHEARPTESGSEQPAA